MTSSPASAPGRRPFYKYASEETVLAVLGSQNVRYSSPLAFNDPFDIQSGLHIDFDLETLPAKVISRIQELASSPVEPQVDATDPFGRLVLAARNYYPTHGFPEKLWKELIQPMFAPILTEISSAQEHYRQGWRNSLPGMRVFCVTEDWDNLLMWAHYARDHKGAVLEFWSLPDEDNPLSVATPVQYRSKPPPFFTEDQWVDDLTGFKKLEVKELYHRYACIKSDHWSYEKEWRVWYPTESSESFEDLRIRASEFTGLFFGCSARPEFIEQARQLLAPYPDVRVAQARRRDEAYALDLIDL